MGFKLAGYEHFGGVEIDPKIADIYRRNHHPKYLFVEDMRDFNKRDDLPEELYHLDVLSGSPPCSAFSKAGERESAWGKEKRFDEGQKLQRLDDLVFVYCDTIAKLKPKCYILENVVGLIEGNAKSYARRIMEKLVSIGYTCQVFRLNAARMGVPQVRERVFFIGHKAEYELPKLALQFDEPPIPFGDIMERDNTTEDLSAYQRGLWERRTPRDNDFGDIIKRLYGRHSMFNNQIIRQNRVLLSLHSGSPANALYDIPRRLSEKELLLASTFPLDYSYPSINKLYHLTGMSVPPAMMANISYEIYEQWLEPLKFKQ